MKEAQPALESRSPASSAGARATCLPPPAYGIASVDSALAAAPVQRSGSRALAFDDPNRIRSAALQGIAGPGEPLPYLDRIAPSFGRFDVSKIVAHTDSAARAGARAMGASGFAMGNHVAFAGRPSLHTAAHEAAHVVQQRAGVQLEGGVGRVGDPYERHADAVAEQVVQGRSAEALLGQLAGPGPSGPPPVQRNFAFDILNGEARDFTWSYMQKLIEEHKVASELATLLKKACLHLLDYAVRITNLADYLAVMNPYVEILRGIKNAIASIPEPIQVLLTYGIGYGIRQFSRVCLRDMITEAHISGMLIQGGTAAGVVGKAIEILYDVGHNPASAIYNSVWAGVGLTKAFVKWWSGEAPKPADPVAEEPDKPMIDAEYGWFWLTAEAPKIGTWKEDQKDGTQIDRGGLQLVGRFGVKIFDEVMGAKAVIVNVPYDSRQWSASFKDVSLMSHPVTLGKFFKGGPIMLNHVQFGQEGLQSLFMTIDVFDFGNGVVTAQKLTMSYSEDAKLLHFRGEALLDALGCKGNGTLDLKVGTAGEFRGGGVRFTVPETFTLVKDRATLTNPEAWATWTEEETGIAIRGDLDFNLGGVLAFESKQTTIQYTSEEGFVGKVETLDLTLPVHQNANLHLKLLDVVIDKTGFTAGKVSLIYAYGDHDSAKNEAPGKPGGTAEPQAGSKPPVSNLAAMVPGFNLDWIKIAGLETLVVDLSATKVAIGPKGIDVGKYSKEVTKFKAQLFGLGAEFDGVAKTGKIKGELARKLDIPAIALRFPIVPGVSAAFDLSAGVGFEAAFGAKLERLKSDDDTPEIHPWKLSNKALLTAKADMTIAAGVSVGVPYLAEISGSLFATADGTVSLDADVTGTVLWNNDTNELSLSDKIEDKPSATLTGNTTMSAALGAKIKGRLFYFFDTELWSHRFVSWQLGEWSLSAKMVANAQGNYDLVRTKSGFGGEAGVPETLPVVEKVRVSAPKMIEDLTKNGDKITDPHQMWRVVHDLMDSNASVPMETRHYGMLKAVNGTKLNLDTVIEEVLGFFGQRNNPRNASLLMLPDEWVAYSTTGKALSSDPSERSSILPVDAAVVAYHKTKVLSERKQILNNLIQVLIPNYTKQHIVSRKDMADKLSTDAQLELTRITLLHQ